MRFTLQYTFSLKTLASLLLFLAASAIARQASCEKVVMTNQPPADSSPNQTAGQWLHAGPIRLKLEDGQIRYLRVGDKEIIRRVYFAVRDGNWATAMPTQHVEITEKAADHFSARVTAECKLKAVDYSWAGTITGAADGKITFTAEGSANADFESNRIGLCVLFGAGSLVGQSFETDGKPTRGEFPALVSPTLVGEQFHSLRYTTAEGLAVSVSLEGATFDMEDQRNWGDSSWKAYAPLPYAYKSIGKGDKKSETVTISVSGSTDAKASAQDPVRTSRSASRYPTRKYRYSVPLAGRGTSQLTSSRSILAARNLPGASTLLCHTPR